MGPHHSWITFLVSLYGNRIIHGLSQIRSWRQGSYHKVAKIVHNVLDDFLSDILE